MGLLEEALLQKSASVQFRRWMTEPEHQAEIRRMMPRQGGVLVLGRVERYAHVGIGEPREYAFLDAFVAGSGSDENTVLEQFGPERKVLRAPHEGFEVVWPYLKEWIPAPEGPTPAPDLTGLRSELLHLEQMFADLEAECRQEKAVLDLEWKGIDAQDNRIRERMKRVRPKRGGAGARPEENRGAEIDEALRREEDRLNALRHSQRREIENERADIAAEAGAIAALQREFDWYIAAWRCPANLTLEQCEQPQAQNPERTIHLEERLATRARREAMRTEIATRTRALEARRRAWRPGPPLSPGSASTA